MAVMEQDKTFTLRKPLPADGYKMWELVNNSKSLDLNSLYHYILMPHHFGDSSIIAFDHDKIAGFVTSYFPPGKEETLFVWQVCVANEFQGNGLGKKMLCHLAKSGHNRNVKYIEATVTPSNKASIALFTSTAKELKADFVFEEKIFPEEYFNGSGHEPEVLFQIGPIN